MKHQTIPGKEVIQVSSWRNGDKVKSGSQQRVILPPVNRQASTVRICLTQKHQVWETLNGRSIKRLGSVALVTDMWERKRKMRCKEDWHVPSL